MSIDITADSTPEEINDYVDSVVAEVEEERAGTEKKPDTSKPDSQIISETAEPAKEAKEPPKKKPKETPVVEDKSDDEAGPSWMDDDTKAAISAYGIEESELADFASREELERALRLFDKNALEAGRKAMADSDEPSKEQGKSEEEPKEEPKEESETARQAADGQYKVQLDKEVYDEEIIGEFSRMRDHYESRLEVLEARFLEADARADEERFDSAVDKLDMPKLFGKTGSESKDELQRRKDLMVQCQAQKIGLKQLTGKDTDLESLVSRVAPMVFAEDFDKQKLKTRTRKISRQSNGRQGGGVTRPSDPREDPRDEFDRLYKELSGA